MEAKDLTTHTLDTQEDTKDAVPDDTSDPAKKTFRDLGVAEPICVALEAAGITSPFPIQALALPIALDGHDVIGQARTGTGKTLAFGIPILEQLLDAPAGEPSAPRALVVVPTRELAIQVGDDLRATGSGSTVSVVTLYGGRAYEPQIQALLTVDVVVGTPGRLLDLTRQGHLKLSDVRTLVLDEADKMLDLGFLPDVEKILARTPADRQTMLFSATMPGEVVTLARRHLSQPIHVRAEQHDEPTLVPSTEQHVFRAHHMDKVEVLARVLQAEGRGLTIVFCRTKRTADQLASALATRGFAAAAVHGDLGQAQRERAMRAFRSGKVDVLVATDVAARGLDVDDVTHVVNHECPEDEKAYLHRIGRTGRAGKAGVAVTFVDWRDLSRWKLINDSLGLGYPEPEETYSTSDHLYTALRIPRDATGTLPRARRERLGLEAENLEDIGETGHVRSRAARTTRPPGSGRAHGDAGRAGDHGDGPGDRAARQRRTRTRRRTRAGVPTEAGGAPHAAAGHTTAGHTTAGHPTAGHPTADHADPASQGPAGGPGTHPDSVASARPARRRRRRSGRGGLGGLGGRVSSTAPETDA